ELLLRGLIHRVATDAVAVAVHGELQTGVCVVGEAGEVRLQAGSQLVGLLRRQHGFSLRTSTRPSIEAGGPPAIFPKIVLPRSPGVSSRLRHRAQMVMIHDRSRVVRREERVARSLAAARRRPWLGPWAGESGPVTPAGTPGTRCRRPCSTRRRS